eukprot:7387808-Prymnesium_polylepis.1
MIGLVVFYAGGEHHVPALGVGFLVPSSVVELSGFIIILAANIVVVLLKDRGSFAARWCKSAVDDPSAPRRRSGTRLLETPPCSSVARPRVSRVVIPRFSCTSVTHTRLSDTRRQGRDTRDTLGALGVRFVTFT